MDSTAKEKYQNTVEELHRKIFDDRTLAYSKYDTGRTSASLFHLRPEIAIAQHSHILRQIFFNQRRAHADQYHLDLLIPNVSVEGEGAATLFSGLPTIMCSFHYGAYRLVLPYALSRGLKISMLIDHRVAKDQGRDFQEILSTFCAARNLPNANVRIRDTANPAMLLSLIRDIRAGFTILVFIDGNMGAGQGTNANDHTTPIDFLGAKLHSRMGVTMVSHLAKCPIIPVLAHRDANCLWTTRFHVFAPIAPKGDTERDTYLFRASSALWAPLEQAVREDPVPWESWRYVDRFLDIEALRAPHQQLYRDAEPEIVVFNDRRFVLANDYKEPILFDRATYRVHTITPTLFKYLHQFVGMPRSRQYALTQPKMSLGTWRKLVDMDVLHGDPLRSSLNDIAI